MLWAASIAGCGSGWRKTTDLAGGAVGYVRQGYVVCGDVEATLRLADPDERLRQFAASARRIDDRFLVPSETFEWLVKQAARARRMEARGDP